MGVLNMLAAAEGKSEGTMTGKQAGRRFLGGAMGAYSGFNNTPTTPSTTPTDVGYVNSFDTGAMANATGYTSPLSGLESFAFNNPELISGAMKLGSGEAQKALLAKLSPQQKRQFIQQRQAGDRDEQIAQARMGRPNRAFGYANFQG
jgi:hypothetical protein